MESLSTYYQANILKICLYGLINGMGLLLGANTLNFWLASFGIDLKIIGFFSIISLPYACKYFIAIFIDEIKISFLERKFGRYKSWLMVSQATLTITLMLMGFLNPVENLLQVAGLGFLLALCSVIQYVILNGHRIQILKEAEQGAGGAMYNIGYRLGMFLTGAGVIYLSVYINWQNIYLILALIYLILSLIVYFTYLEPTSLKRQVWQKENETLLHNVFIGPLKHFQGYKNLIWIILFILLYQASDGMLMTMLNPFLLDKHYNAEEIASASKICGIVMVIIGGFLGGIIVDKLSIRKSLLSFGFLHSLGYLMFIALSYSDKNILSLYFITGYVAFTGGMTATAYITFISGLSKGQHATTLYALLSSIVGIVWVVFPVVSGVIADSFGWSKFFIIIAAIGLATLVFTWFIPDRIYKIYKNEG